MSEHAHENQESIPPMPDILDTDNLSAWMREHTVSAPKGYEDMTHPDGTPFTLAEQINAHIKQIVAVIEFMKGRNTPRQNYSVIAQVIKDFTQPEKPT